jgi:hypothetical protein
MVATYGPGKTYKKMKYLIRISIVPLLEVFCCSMVFSQPNGNTGSLLFSNEEVLEFTLSGNFRELMNDRVEQQYHPFRLTHTGDQGSTSIPVRVRTRGHFRLAKGNCQYPPLLLNFAKKQTSSDPLFSGQDKMKLVTPCRGEKYVIQEYMVYKLSNLITPKSFRARLVKVVYEDTVKGKSTEPLFGILLEEEEQMAKRNNAISIDKKSMRPEQTDREDFLKMAVFEYLIGNTDWSIQYLQNVKLIAEDSSMLPSTVPYDFDHAGIVRAPYAKPAEQLLLSSTLERRYRGYCMTDMAQFQDVFAYFNGLKDEIYKLYTDSPLLDEKYVKATVKFFDEFYETINDPKKAQVDFMYPCDKNGTGNVVIQGLNRD